MVVAGGSVKLSPRQKLEIVLWLALTKPWKESLGSYKAYISHSILTYFIYLFVCFYYFIILLLLLWQLADKAHRSLDVQKAASTLM